MKGQPERKSFLNGNGVFFDQKGIIRNLQNAAKGETRAMGDTRVA